MKKSYNVYNKEHVQDEVIFRHLKTLSNEQLDITGVDSLEKSKIYHSGNNHRNKNQNQNQNNKTTNRKEEISRIIIKQPKELMSNAFQIRGGKPLSGEITPQGAKTKHCRFFVPCF